MTTILLMLMFPIGMVFYYNERKSRGKYQAVFDDYIDKVDSSTELSDIQKLERVQKLFLANRYEVVSKTEDEIVAERKIFSMGLFMMGLFFYVFYYFFFQKPHSIGYKVK
jgi:preprotein translocase subunit SecF